MNFITRSLHYYEGDRAEPWDQPCARRPSAQHVFTGIISLDPTVMWRAKTPAEVDAEKDDEATRKLADDKVVRLLFEINFEQENRLRNLQGQQSITRAQYRNALIATYKSL